MRKFILGLALMCGFLSSQGDIVLHLEKNGQGIGERAFNLFQNELELSIKENKDPLFILPTGSTPLPFYQKIVSSFYEGKLNLSKAIFFNLDEYVGLDSQDPQSYYYFMNTQLYDYILPGLNLQKLRYFGLTHLTKKECSNTKLRGRLNQAIDTLCEQLIDASASSIYTWIDLDTIVSELRESDVNFKRLESNYMNDYILPSILSLKSWIEKDISLRSFAPSTRHIYRLNGIAEDLQKEASSYKNKLLSYLDREDCRVICFAGIGADPAHIAFNDFVANDTFMSSDYSEEQKNRLARELGTRVVNLSEGTRKSNARFFDDSIEKVPKQALTLGFEEILRSDRIIVLAGGKNKKRALYDTFASSPSYRVPSSFLRTCKGKQITFVLDLDSFGVGEPHSLFSMNLHPKQSCFELVHSDLNKVQLWDVPHLPKSALVLKAQKKLDPRLYYASIPQNKRVLWIKKGKLHYSLWRRFKEKQNTLEVMDKWTLSTLKEKIEKLKPEVLVLPYTQEFVSWIGEINDHLRQTSAGQPILGLFYDVGASYSNVHLPLLKADLKKKTKALKLYHQSQSKRSNFDLITHEMTRSQDPISSYIESFTFYKLVSKEGIIEKEYYPNQTYIQRRGKKNRRLKKVSAFSFEKGDLVLSVSPHPDDTEIGLGGLVSFLEGEDIPTIILNATSGHRALIKKEDLSKHPKIPEELLTKLAMDTSEYVENKEIKSKIREYESQGALKFLNPKCTFYQLNLPFYEARRIGDQDRAQIDEFFNQHCQGVNRLFVFLPHPIDQHKTHRQTHELFKERIDHYFRENPDQEIVVAYYSTPWTGNWNLYDYSSNYGSKLYGLIGAEQLMGHGSFASSTEVLGGTHARRYRLFYFDN